MIPGGRRRAPGPRALRGPQRRSEGPEKPSPAGPPPQGLEGFVGPNKRKSSRDLVGPSLEPATGLSPPRHSAINQLLRGAQTASRCDTCCLCFLVGILLLARHGSLRARTTARNKNSWRVLGENYGTTMKGPRGTRSESAQMRSSEITAWDSPEESGSPP